MTGSTRRYDYGFTISSAPPVVPVDRIQRVVNGVQLVYLRRAGRVRVFDGTKELKIPRETEKEILRAWPAEDGTRDELDWWN